MMLNPPLPASLPVIYKIRLFFLQCMKKRSLDSRQEHEIRPSDKRKEGSAARQDQDQESAGSGITLQDQESHFCTILV